MAKTFKERVEEGTIWTMAGLGILVSVLDIFGLLHHIAPIEKSTQDITLLLLSSVACYLLLERRSNLDRLHSRMEEIYGLVFPGITHAIKTLGGVEVQPFKRDEDLLQYLVTAIEQATESVDDLTWQPHETVTKTDHTKKLFNNYINAKRRLSEQEKFSYREVIAVSTSQALREVEDGMTKGAFNYQIRCYGPLNQESPPLLSFLIIDSKEVIVAAYRHAHSDTDGEIEIRLSIKHPDIVELFKDYYNAIWEGAKSVKEGEKINKPALEALRQRVLQVEKRQRSHRK